MTALAVFVAALLALLQIDNPKPPKASAPANFAVGQHVLADRTDDIKTVIARLKEIGAAFVVDPVETPEGLIGRLLGNRR